MKILIADDHSVVRTGLGYVLESLAEEVTLLEAADFKQATQVIKANRELDLLLLDLAMPGINNLNAITELRDIIPATPIVIFSASEDTQTIFETIQKGAQGFIPKSSPREVVIAALQNVLAGDVYLPTELLKNSNSSLNSQHDRNYRDPAQRILLNEKLLLTQRQREVLLLICEGGSNNDIASRLNITLATVKTHITHLFQTLGVSNRSQAAYKARAMGLIRKENPIIEK